MTVLLPDVIVGDLMRSPSNRGGGAAVLRLRFPHSCYRRPG